MMRNINTKLATILVIAGMMASPWSLATQTPMQSGLSCPYNHICEGDIVLFSWMSTRAADDDIFNPVNGQAYAGAQFYVSLADKPNFPDDYKLVYMGGSDFRSIWYRTLPNTRYTFAVVIRITYHKPGQTARKYRFLDPIDFKYISKNYDHSAPRLHNTLIMDPHTGVISATEATAMGLPKAPECKAGYAEHYICRNQIVHLFWNNDRGIGNYGQKMVSGISLEADGKTVIYGGAERTQFFYTVPATKYRGVPITFKLHYRVHDSATPAIFYNEDSQPLTMKFYPSHAGYCETWDSRYPWCH